MKNSRMKAYAREHVIGVLSFARDMNRGYTEETWTPDRACARNDQRMRHFERATDVIQALYVVGLLTAASASRCACLLRGYCINNEWARRDADESFSQAMDGVEVW